MYILFQRVPVCCSRLRIWYCHCSSLGYYRGAGFIPCLGELPYVAGVAQKHPTIEWIKKTIQIPHQYKLKIKDVDRNLLEYGIYNSIGDSPIYPSTEFINSFRPYNVYSTSFNENEIKSYNNKTSEYVPIEYKHYNASIFVNLEEKFDIKETKNFLYSQLIEKQSKENTFNVFKNYINRRKNIQYSDDDLLFLYNKYKVEYDTVPVGLNIKKTEKIYSLTYRFTLL